MTNIIIKPGDRWTLADLMEGAAIGNKVALSDEAKSAICRSSDWVDQISSQSDLLYGVNTGFGALADRRVREGDEEELQRRHILSHASGIGQPAPDRVVRMMMLIKLLTFRNGHTGVSLAVVERLVTLLNEGIHPLVPEQGTVGASGDLAPLAHLSLPLLGLGHVFIDGKRQTGAEALKRLGLGPVALAPKDGLALTNGTQFISAVAVTQLARIVRLTHLADMVASVSLQAFSCADRFFHERYHREAGNRWRAVVAKNLREYTEGSNHASLPTATPSKQDPYSFRCIPQVHGAAREQIAHARNTILDEVNTTADNPLFFPDEGLALFGGNLHGESVAMSADVLAIAATELASISERRTYQLLGGRRGLPDFLTTDPGVNSGLMIIQYSSAALVSESKSLSHPGSVDSIPTCQLQEDHVSMGGTSVLKLKRVVDNLEHVLAIELMTAYQAVDLSPQLELSPRCQAQREEFRKVVDYLSVDRVLKDDIESSVDFLRAIGEPDIIPDDIFDQHEGVTP